MENMDQELEQGDLLSEEQPEAAAVEELKKKKVKWWQIVLVSLAGLVLLVSLTVALWWSIAGVKSMNEGFGLIKEIFTTKTPTRWMRKRPQRTGIR